MKDKIIKTIKAKFLGEYINSGDKEKSLIIFIVGFSFLIILIIILKINYSNVIKQNIENNTTNNIEEVDYLSLNKLFINYIDNYIYNIEILDNDIIVNYSGSVNNQIDNGKRFYNNEIINYQIENENVINTDNNQTINNLYGDYLAYFFIPSNVYSYIENLEYKEEIIDNNKIYNYNSIYNESDIMFNIITTKDRIEEINYKYNEVNYKIKLN